VSATLLRDIHVQLRAVDVNKSPAQELERRLFGCLERGMGCEARTMDRAGVVR
jgi:hypothetical protein